MEQELINFYSENDFVFDEMKRHSQWLEQVIEKEGKELGGINYIFCDDEYLLEINQKYLNHDTYTDIISFDDSVGKILQGDIYISTERVAENAKEFNVSFDEELLRVLVHGVLHFCGYKDKTKQESDEMRKKEEEMMIMFHVEQ